MDGLSSSPLAKCIDPIILMFLKEDLFTQVFLFLPYEDLRLNHILYCCTLTVL